MANIMGLELKNSTIYNGHEGEELIKGDLFLKGKKIGTFKQDIMMGPDVLNLDSRKEEVVKIAKQYFEKHPFGFIPGKLDLRILFKKSLVSGLITELAEISKIENTFKKATQQGYKYLVRARKSKMAPVMECYVRTEKELNALKAANEEIVIAISSLNDFIL